MSELVDLVNSSGEVQLRGIPRSEVPHYPDLHMQIVIAVVVDSLGRMLVHRRAKEPNIGSYDHICGAISSGESPEEAAAREATEETGVQPRELRVVAHGVNEYSRYRYLLVGQTQGEPPIGNPAEVQWVGYLHPDELRAGQASGEFAFVDGFFEDVALALSQDESLPPPNPAS